MAASTLSFGMLAARAFWKIRLNAALECGSGPPDLTAILISFAILANCLDMRFQRANIACFLTSNMRPIGSVGVVRVRQCTARGVTRPELRPIQQLAAS